MRRLLLSVFTMLSLAVSGWAQPANLEGSWTLVESGHELTRHLFFLAGGPSWKASSNGKLMVTLDLEPTAKENQWTGVLKEWEEFKVSAVLTSPDQLKLSEIGGKRRWTMQRHKAP